jgi:hypothetical protein
MLAFFTNNRFWCEKSFFHAGLIAKFLSNNEKWTWRKKTLDSEHAWDNWDLYIINN